MFFPHTIDVLAVDWVPEGVVVKVTVYVFLAENV